MRNAIYHKAWGLKATGVNVDDRCVSALVRASDWMLSDGAEAVVLGCTELSMASQKFRFAFIDSTDALAKEMIARFLS